MYPFSTPAPPDLHHKNIRFAFFLLRYVRTVHKAFDHTALQHTHPLVMITLLLLNYNNNGTQGCAARQPSIYS